MIGFLPSYSSTFPLVYRRYQLSVPVARGSVSVSVSIRGPVGPKILSCSFSLSYSSFPLKLALALTTFLGGEVAGQDEKGSPGSDGASPYLTGSPEEFARFSDVILPSRAEGTGWCLAHAHFRPWQTLADPWQFRKVRRLAPGSKSNENRRGP